MNYRKTTVNMFEAWMNYINSPGIDRDKINIVSFAAGYNACLEQMKEKGRSLKDIVEDYGLPVKVKSINDKYRNMTLICECGNDHYLSITESGNYFYVLKEFNLTNDYVVVFD